MRIEVFMLRNCVQSRLFAGLSPPSLRLLSGPKVVGEEDDETDDEEQQGFD